jgi:hypothetical protein
MRRVFFVGIHHKPGLPALCSTTKSGKVIDQIIAELPEFECIKTNLFTTAFETPLVNAAHYWRKRVGWQSGDITILLGGKVVDYFKKEHGQRSQDWYAAAHPSRAGSYKYVSDIVRIIKNPTS